MLVLILSRHAVHSVVHTFNRLVQSSQPDACIWVLLDLGQFVAMPDEATNVCGQW